MSRNFHVSRAGYPLHVKDNIHIYMRKYLANSLAMKDKQLERPPERILIISNKDVILIAVLFYT